MILAIGGRAAPAITAAIIGVLAVTIAAAIAPDQMTARKPGRHHPAAGLTAHAGRFPR